MSAWKLVEAVAEVNHESTTTSTTTPSNTNSTRTSSSYSGRGSGRGRGGRSSSESSRGRGRHNGTATSPNHNSATSPKYPGPYRNKADRSYFSYLAVQQIDQIFNPDSLCIDTYIRSYMDEAGYVPVTVVCTYQNVTQYQCTYNDILNKLKETVIKCKYIELDAENETVRLKNGWEKFLMPNAFGGRGLPRYLKQPSNGNKSNGNTESETVEGTTSTTNNVPTIPPQDYYAYFAAQAAAYGGYYPTEYTYDPNYQYYPDPNAYAYAPSAYDSAGYGVNVETTEVQAENVQATPEVEESISKTETPQQA